MILLLVFWMNKVARQVKELTEKMEHLHNLASQLWLGLVRLGGHVGETGELLSEEELRSLTFQNRENADDDVRMSDGGSSRSRSTSRHDTPMRRGSPESALFGMMNRMGENHNPQMQSQRVRKKMQIEWRSLWRNWEKEKKERNWWETKMKQQIWEYKLPT